MYIGKSIPFKIIIAQFHILYVASYSYAHSLREVPAIIRNCATSDNKELNKLRIHPIHTVAYKRTTLHAHLIDRSSWPNNMDSCPLISFH